MPLDLPQHLVGLHVTDDDQRRVAGNVEPPVMRVEVVARHRLEVVQPADRRMTVGMRAKRRRGQLGIEHLLGIVVATLQLRDDDRPLRFALVGIEQAVVHPLGLDEQHLIERVAARRLEVGRLVDPGIAVPHPAEAFDDALHVFAGNVGRCP